MELKLNRTYRHFKGNIYLVKDIVKHSETMEDMVLYQALYGDYGMFVRPLSMFLEEVPEGREDNVLGQKYRFELFDIK